jgi:photosystem II stability/assembly factor-like uncharacterized protein
MIHNSRLAILLFLLFLLCVNSFSQTYWLKQASPTQKRLTKSLFVDSAFGWVIGDSGTIIRTTNSGSSWSLQQSGDISAELRDLTFISRSTGWIIAVDSVYKTFILHTTDSGLNWSKTYYPDSTIILNTICFLNQQTGFVSGFEGHIFITSNAGSSWKESRIDTSGCLYLFPKNDIYFINSQTGFACGGVLDIQGIFLKTTNGGLNWRSMCISAEPMNEILDLGGGRIAVVGGDYDLGSIYAVSSDYGDNWSYEPMGCFGNATSFAFRTPSEVWAALSFSGLFSVNLDSMKPGTPWQCINTPGNVAIYSIKFLSPVLGYAFGGEGSIYKYNENVIGIQNNQNIVSEQFILYQNYPNPFNPETRIMYNIPKDENVNLKIYNSSGQLLKEMDLGMQTAGVHSFEFSGESFASGIYFYKLTAGKYSESRKMVILK